MQSDNVIIIYMYIYILYIDIADLSTPWVVTCDGCYL